MSGQRTSVAALALRVLVRDRDDDKLQRIVHMDASIDEIWLKDVSSRNWPYRLSYAKFVQDFERPSPRYEIVFDEPTPLFIVPPNCSHTATNERQKQHWAIMELLLLAGASDERTLMFPVSRRPLIVAACEQFNVTRQTVVNILIRYWQRGMTAEALRPDFQKCGAPGSPRNITSDQRVGRRRTISPGQGLSVNDDLRRIFEIAALHWLNSKKKKRLPDAYDFMVQKFYSDQIKADEGGQVRVVVFRDKPSIRQFRHFIKTHYRQSYIYKKREGEKNWNSTARAILGRGDHGTQGPGDRFQVDATVADIYLVSQYDRRRVLRRPIIYFVIDVWSRLIVGVYVGFEGPSWVGAMMTLVNMVSPKVEFCKQYGISIEAAEWPACHAPKVLLADKGELSSVGLTEQIEAKLRIHIENAASGRADFKSIIERRFGTVPAVWKPFAPGYVESDYGQRGARDYKLDAKLNLYEFTQLVILSVLEHNSKPVSGYRTPAAMTTDRRIPVCLELWNWGIENRSGVLRHVPVHEVALAVMPQDKARVTPSGIKFKGAYYECATAMKEEWFSLARHKSSWEVDVSYDLRMREVLYLRDESLPRGFEACTLLPSYADCVGKTHFEAEEIARAEKVQLAATADLRQEKRIERHMRMRQIVSNATAEADLVRDPRLSKAQRLSSIKENHATEKAVQRRREAHEFASKLSPVTNVQPAGGQMSSSESSYEAQLLAYLKQHDRESRDE